jgi:osmotically-inducible protein OsmY
MNNDSQLQGSVLDEIKWWPNVDAAHIGVAAQDGIVTLTGQVASYTAKAAAEDATKSVYGVKGIANDIKVEWYDSDKRSDQDIAAAALAV